MLKELQEQFTFGCDVQLFVDAPAMVLNRADSDAETGGDARRRVPGQDQLHQPPLPE
jgi:hypothetical protein